jgi:hypothetical protein
MQGNVATDAAQTQHSTHPAIPTERAELNEPHEFLHGM